MRGLQGTVEKFAGSLSGLAAGVTAAFSFKKVIDETKEAQAALAQLTIAYQNSAQAAKRSKQDILDFSDAAQQASTFSDEAVTRSQTTLLRFSRINKDTFDRARKDILDVAAAMGGDLESAAFSVGRALDSPAQGMRELRALGIVLTDSQRKLIQTLDDTGDRAKAQAIILDELEKRYDGAAQAARATLGGALSGLKNAFGDLFESSDKGANEVADGVNKISDVISDPKFKANIQSLTGELLSFVGAFANVVATSIDGLKNLGQYAAGAAEAVTKVPTKLDALYQKQSNLGASLNAALEEQSGIARNGVNDPRRSRELAEQIQKLREAMVAVSKEVNNARQGAGNPQRAGSRQRTAPGSVNFISDEQLQQERDDALARARLPISEVIVTQQKAQLEGLAKLLDDFEQSTRTSEEKIYQDYHDTVLKIQELTGKISPDEQLKRLKDARIKYEEAVTIDPVKVTQSKVVIQQTLTEQQRAVDKFVDTLSTGLENLARSGELTGRSILKYLLSAFEAQVLKDAIDGLGSYLKKALGGTGGASSSGIGAFLSGIFGAFGHAAGGSRMSGPRIVGEDGPELDMGGGNILNRRQLAFAGAGGGGVTLNTSNVWNIDGSASPTATAQYVESRMQSNNRKLLEQVNRLMRDNYGRSLR